MSRIFISHSHLDNAAALAIAQWLQTNGWPDYYLDISPEKGISPGERWQEALKAAANRCEAVLFLISPDWRDAPWCLAEFLLAKQIGKKVFGILIRPTALDSLPGELTTEWQLCNLVDGEQRKELRVHHDPIVPSTVVSFAEAGLERLRNGLKRAGIDASSFPWPPDTDLQRVPYRGLKPLESEDAAVFFGRDAAIVRGLDALRTMLERGVEGMLVIVGASGAGKSSFLRAGLWPRLAKDDNHFLPLPVIRPGRAVISGVTGLAASLEAAFGTRGAQVSRANVRDKLQAVGRLDGVCKELQGLLGPGSRAATVLIAVDQAEELFAAEGQEESQEFLALMAETLERRAKSNSDDAMSGRRALAVMCIRSDFLQRLQTEGSLQHVSPYLFSLPPVARTEFKTVIEGPAAVHRQSGRLLRIDSALTEKLLEDAQGADALPLLAFTLERLFIEHGGDGDLRLDEYEAMGGVRGSIGAAVDAAFSDPGADPAVPTDKAVREQCLRQAFIPWLARVDPDTEERKRRVARWDEIPVGAQPLLERLIAQRLLVRDRRKISDDEPETVVLEVAHEALLRQWPALAGWLDQDADALKTLDAVHRAASEWKSNLRGAAWLVHSEERLEAAETLRARPDFDRLLGVEGKYYLVACREREQKLRAEHTAQLEREARAQRLAGVLLVLTALILTGATALVVMKSREVGRQTSLVLASAAQAASEIQSYDRALRYAILAARDGLLSPASPEAEAQLVRAAHASMLLVRLEGHRGAVLDAALSPDGHRAVTASGDTTARVWNMDTGEALFTLWGHKKAVVSAAFSPDGKRVVTASDDATARVWDVERGEAVALLAGHLDKVRSAIYSTDGRRILTCSADGTARIWDAASGKLITSLHGHEDQLRAIATSADGRRIVTASDDTSAKIWDAETGKQLTTLQGHDDWISSAMFSPDGELVVTTSWDKTARLWDSRTGASRARLSGHQDTVTSASFSRDAQFVVTASSDNSARIWDTKTGALIATLAGHQKGVNAAIFTADGRRIITASSDNTARIWDVESGKAIAALVGHEGAILSASSSIDGAVIITASEDATARVWRARGEQPANTVIRSNDELNTAVFSADGRRIVTASTDKTASVWDSDTGRLVAALAGHTDRINSAAVSADGSLIVTGSDDATARVWDARTGRLVTTFAEHRMAVNSAQFSADGRRVVTASDDQTVQLWDARTAESITTLTGHGDWILWAELSADGQRVVTASSDNTARIWNAQTGAPIANLTGHRGSVNSASFSSDGRFVVTASSDKTARIWDARSAQLVATLAGHRDAVNNPRFNDDGSRVVTASADATAKIWDSHTTQAIATLSGHDASVASAVFSPDGRRILTASQDHTARIWDVGWLVQHRGAELLDSICKARLAGAHTLTNGDVTVAPILLSRRDEDVCRPVSTLAKASSWMSGIWKTKTP